MKSKLRSEKIKNNVLWCFKLKAVLKGSLFLFTSQTSYVPRESPPTLLTLFVFVLKFLLLVLSVM